MPDVFDLRRPLRNHFTQIDLLESLGVIRAYAQHLQFDKELPSDIDVIPEFINAKNRIDKKVYEWELEILAKEVIINSPEIASKKTLKTWNYFSLAINKLKDLENEIAKLYPPKLVLLELYRLAHRQFPWQTNTTIPYVARYYQIFSYPEVEAIIKQEIGLSVDEIFKIGFAITGSYFDIFFLFYPPRIEIPGIDQAKLDKFLKHFSLQLDQIKAKLVEAQSYDENYAYAYNPLRAFPLLKTQWQNREAYICPLPTLLLYRFTAGLYYEICRAKDFSIPFGKSFESYTGRVLDRANESKQFLIHKEQEYFVGKNKKDSTDWVIEDSTAAVFIECKTKRLRQESKTQLLTQEALEEDLEKAAQAIVQIYKAIKDFKDGHYKLGALQKQAKIYPLLVTLEEWYAFGNLIVSKLNEKVRLLFAQESLDFKWLEEMPFAMCSIEELEIMAQIMGQVGIKSFMTKKAGEKVFWPFSSFMKVEFLEQLRKTKNLFPEFTPELFQKI